MAESHYMLPKGNITLRVSEVQGIIMKKGFSLVEIMIVIAVVGIIIAVMVPNLMDMIRHIRTNKLNADLDTMAKQAVFFYESKGRWPVKFTDFMEIPGGGPPKSSFRTEFSMDDFFFYVQVPGEELPRRYLYRRYYMMIEDGVYSHKIYPIFYYSHEIASSIAWFNTRRGALKDNLQFYFIQNLDNLNLYLIIEANADGLGNVKSFTLENVSFPAGTTLATPAANMSVDIEGGIISASGISNQYSGAIFSIPYNEPWFLRFKVTDLTPNSTSTPVRLGYISGEKGNFLHLGERTGKQPQYYIGRTYEINYVY